MKTKTQKLVTTAMLAALACIATMIINIPSPYRGNMNMGDCVVLIAGWILSPFYGFLAASIGSALADVFGGYVMYAPATFVIKGLMAVVAGVIMRFLGKKLGNFSACIISGIVAELIMIAGYFVFEGFLYGFVPSLVNIPANGIQGTAGLIIGTVIMKLFEKSKSLVRQ